MRAQLRDILMRLRDSLPEALGSRLRSRKFQYSARATPEVPRAKNAPIRFYIAPANYAGQGYMWARASETIPGVGAINLQVGSNKFTGPTDFSIEEPFFHSSKRWQRHHFEIASTGFSHVMIEACLPLFGPLFRRNIEAEVRELQRRGVRVAMMCHGTEIRLPSRHAKEHSHSPFSLMSDKERRVYEHRAARNRRILDSLGVPVFVSTPALKVDVPYGVWVPVVVENCRWETSRAILKSKVPVVVHAPSRAILKRSDLIDEALTFLESEGEIVYERLRGIPNSEMPETLKRADILVDAVGTGNYGVAACEAMASGCLVVSYITEQVAGFVESETGLELPIVRTEPDDVVGIIRAILDNRKRYRVLASQGPAFVTKIHNGAYSASVLRSFLTDG